MTENFILNAVLSVTFHGTDVITSAQFQGALSIIPNECVITGVEPVSATDATDSDKSFVTLTIRFRSNGVIPTVHMIGALQKATEVLQDASVNVTVEDRIDYAFSKELQDAIDNLNEKCASSAEAEDAELEEVGSFEQVYLDPELRVLVSMLATTDIDGNASVTCIGSSHFRIVYNAIDNILNIEPIDD